MSAGSGGPDRGRATAANGVRNEGDRASWAGLVLLAVGSFLLFLWPTFARGARIGLGPDVSVYLWWARAGAAEGLSVVSERPGIPALLPALTGATGAPWVPVAAGLQYALVTSVGLVAAGALRGRVRTGRWAWLLGGALAGVFAVHLAAGYLANLLFATTFLAAIAALATRTRRGVVAAVLLLAGGGLAHPLFFLLGVAILASAGAWMWFGHEPGDRTDAANLAIAAAGSATLLGAGLLWVSAGPPRIAADTSKDAFLRRVGFDGLLRDGYLERFRRTIWRFVPWLVLPLAVAGTAWVRGLTRRVLVAWAIVTVAGVPLGALTGWFPPSRLLTFAFALPMLAAVGVIRVARAIADSAIPGARAVAWIAGLAAVAILVGASLLTWREAITYATPQELRAAATAGVLAEDLPAGTPLVFVVDDAQGAAVFRATNAANVVRATVPRDRAGDVIVFVGSVEDLLADRPTPAPGPLETLLSEDSLASIPPGPRAVFVLRPFVASMPADGTDGLTRISRDVAAVLPDHAGDDTSVGSRADAVGPSSPTAIAGMTLGVLALLSIVGFGWARWALGEPVTACALAPAFGAAATILVAIVTERLGLAIEAPLGAFVAIGLAAAGGYALLLLQGAGVPQATPQIGERQDREDDRGGGHEPLVHP